MSNTTFSFDLLTIDELAEALDRPVSQLRWMRHKGTGPKSALIGGRITYRRADVEAWIAAAFDDDKVGA